jgi:hypothetical protein
MKQYGFHVSILSDHANRVDQKYIMHDKRYGDLTDPFVVAQSVVNLVELALGVYAVILHMTPRNRPTAMIFALVASVMTWSKTVIYFTIEYCGEMNYTGHNNGFEFMVFFFLPSFVWILMPMLATFSISSRLTAVAHQALGNKTK